MARQSEAATAWIFKAAEDHWDIQDFMRTVRVGDSFWWYFSPRPDLLSEGQRVYLWHASIKKPAIVALARTAGPVQECEDDEGVYWTAKGRAKLGGVQPRAPPRMEHILGRPLTKVQIQHNAGLKDALSRLSVTNWFARQTNFPVQPDEELVLDRECLTR